MSGIFGFPRNKIVLDRLKPLWLNCQRLIKLMSSILQKTKRVAALALIFWVSGAVCILRCEVSKFHSSKVLTTHKTAPHKMASDHSCCRRAKNKHKIFEIQSSQPIKNNTSCCSFTTRPFEQARKVSFQNETAVQAVTEKSWLAQSKQNLPSNFLYRPRPPNKSSTHLRNCVFLI